MNAPVLFLDIDGVLNSRSWDVTKAWDSYPDKPDWMDAKDWWSFDPAAVARLNRVLSATGCLVVVSSNWRTFKEWNELLAIFDAVGVDHVERFIGATPDLIHEEHGPLWLPVKRGEEIAAWRKEHGHTGPFAVVDDNGGMEVVARYFVQTDYDYGLQDPHVERLIRLLGTRDEGR